jgi:hypothetical protein
MDEPTLEEVYQLAKENNQMLKAMRRDAFVKGILGMVWWIFLLVVLPYISWLFIQPYLKTVIDAAQGVQATQNSVNAQLQGLPDFDALLKQFMQGK